MRFIEDCSILPINVFADFCHTVLVLVQDREGETQEFEAEVGSVNREALKFAQGVYGTRKVWDDHFFSDVQLAAADFYNNMRVIRKVSHGKVIVDGKDEFEVQATLIPFDKNSEVLKKAVHEQIKKIVKLLIFDKGEEQYREKLTEIVTMRFAMFKAKGYTVNYLDVEQARSSDPYVVLDQNDLDQIVLFARADLEALKFAGGYYDV